MASFCNWIFILSTLVIGGVWCQEGPRPPLITTCDIMPLIARDLNSKSNLVSCASTAWPICETINCQVKSNNDQLELELLPCWQHPAMWIKNRDVTGKILYQEIFDAPKLSVASIGGNKNVILNVTVVQRGLTLGFGMDIAIPGVMNKTTTMIPYRDIPLNLTECGGDSPDYPLMCKLIRYMEQYIMTAYSGMMHDPAKVPTCSKPKTESCDTMLCSWKNEWDTPVWHTYQFLRCAKPQAFRLILEEGLHVLNGTYDTSGVIVVNATMSLNITVKHPSDQVLGFKVDIINLYSGTLTEIPYTELPLSTTGCPPEKPKTLLPPRHGGKTLYKNGHRHVPTIKHATAEPKSIQISRQVHASSGNHINNNNNNNNIKADSNVLVTTCNIMPQLASAATLAIGNTVICSSSTRPDCNTITCTEKSNNVTLTYTVLPCQTLPAIQIINRDARGNVTFNKTFVNGTESVSADILGWENRADLKVTVVQHPGMLTMGLAVDVRGGNDIYFTNFVPYFEIPINRQACDVCTAPIYPLGFLPSCAVLVRRWTYNATLGKCVEFSFHPCGQPEVGFNVFKNIDMCTKTCHSPNHPAYHIDTATCLVMDGAAQYMTVFLGNLTNSREHTPYCRALRPFCNTFLCTLPNGAGFYNNTFLPCTTPIGFSTHIVDHLANISAKFTLYESSTFNTTSDSSSDLTLDQLKPGMVGFALSLRLERDGEVFVGQEVPYIHIPLNTSVCTNGSTPHPNHGHTHTSNSLIDTCTVLPLVARHANSVLPDTMTCTSSRKPDCNSVTCFILASGETLTFTFLPCHTPPAVMVSISNNGSSRQFVRNFTKSGTITADIGGSSIPLIIDVMQQDDIYATNLTLGIQVSATVGGKNITFVEYVEIPLDRSACPQTTFMGYKSTCEAVYNISQYANYAISNATREPADCIPMGRCEDIIVNVGNSSNNSSIEFAILVCDVPVTVRAIVVDASGAAVFYGRIEDFDSFIWDIGSYNLIVNVTVQHPKQSAIVFKVTFDHSNISGPLAVIPSVTVPLNLTGCSSVVPTTNWGKRGRRKPADTNSGDDVWNKT